MLNPSLMARAAVPPQATLNPAVAGRQAFDGHITQLGQSAQQMEHAQMVRGQIQEPQQAALIERAAQQLGAQQSNSELLAAQLLNAKTAAMKMPLIQAGQLPASQQVEQWVQQSGVSSLPEIQQLVRARIGMA